MGFLLVFFPEENTTIFNNKKKLLPSPSSSSSSPFSSFIKPSNSAHLLSRAQSTISICALLIFITLLLFTLSTFEPTTSSSRFSPRRQLSSSQITKTNSHYSKFQNSLVFPHALQRMGNLYRKGTNSMTDLIVAHVVESLNLHDLRLFLRVYHRSSLASKSDIVFIFPSKSASLDSAILEESDSFLKLVEHYQETILMNSTSNFNGTQFAKWKKTERETGDSIWGRRNRSNSSEGNSTESTRLSYGSVVGFDVNELDPENTLAGFLDNVPMNLRRWACYPLLLGRIKRIFKRITLVDVKEMLLINDPLDRVKNPSPDSVYLSSSTHSGPTRHNKKNSDKPASNRAKSVSPAIIMGGDKGVRRLSNAMLTEIVRKSVQHKKNSVTEFGVFNQLVGNEFLLKNVNLITSAESIPELSSLSDSNKQGSSLSISDVSLLRRGNSNFDVSFTVVKNLLCSSPLDSLFYSDC